MQNPGSWLYYHAEPSNSSLRTKLYVLGKQRCGVIQATEFLPETSCHQHSSRRNCKSVSRVIVLTLVILIIDQQKRLTRWSNGDSELLNLYFISPLQKLRSYNRDRGGQLSRTCKHLKRCGFGGGIVVENPKPTGNNL